MHNTGTKIIKTREIKKKEFEIRNSKGVTSRVRYIRASNRDVLTHQQTQRDGGPVSDYTARYELSTIEQTMAGETLALFAAMKLLCSSTGRSLMSTYKLLHRNGARQAQV